MYRSRGRGRRGGYGASSTSGYGAPARQEASYGTNYEASYTTRNYATQRTSQYDDPPPRDYGRATDSYAVDRPYYGSSSVRTTVRSSRPAPREVERASAVQQPYSSTRRDVYADPYTRPVRASRPPVQTSLRSSRAPPRDFEEYHSRKRPPPSSRSEAHPRKRRDTRPPPIKRGPPPTKRGPGPRGPTKRAPPKRMDKLPPRMPKRSAKKKTPKAKSSHLSKSKEQKKKHITHDMKLRSVIFASGTPGKGKEHGFLVSRNHNHPAIGCIPRVKLGENDWYFVLEVSEHEKDRRRKYSRSSNRGICRWKLLKNDIVAIRTFEGHSVTDPGPVLDFANVQTTMVEGTKDIPISIDDSDGPDEGEKEKAQPAEAENEKADDNSPPTESIVVVGGEETEPVVATEEVEEEIVEEESPEDVVEEPDTLDPESLESLKVTELREKCKERDLYSKGLKRELVSRLREYLTEKAKRIEQQKSKQGETATEAATETEEIFPDVNGEDDDDDIIVEESADKEDAAATTEKTEEDTSAEKPAEKAEEDTGAEPMETEAAATETEEKTPEEPTEQTEAMEVEEQAQEGEEDDQEVELALLDIEGVSDELAGLCAVLNTVQNEGNAYWFVPDLTLLESWQGSEEELKTYLEKIEKPMSFTQLKTQIEDGSLDSVEKIVEAVNLIFKNAKEFNEEGSEWYVNAVNTEKHFNDLHKNLEVEQKLVAVDDTGKLKYADIPLNILKKVIEVAELKCSEDASKEDVVKLAEEAVAKLGVKNDEFDAKELVLSCHRGIVEEESTDGPTSKNNAFYVCLAFNHELRQIHHDRDIISSSHTDKTRMLIFEFRKDISAKLDVIKGNWLKMMKEGPAKGLEKKNVFGEDNAEFEELMTKLITTSNDYYKKEKKFATTEELILSNKKLKSDKESLEKRLKNKSEENRQLKKILDDIYRLSDFKRSIAKMKKSSMSTS